MQEPTPDRDNRPVETYKTDNWLVAKVVGEDDYRFGAYLERLNQRAMWRVSPDEDLTCTREELAELHMLIGRVLAGGPGERLPAEP